MAWSTTALKRQKELARLERRQKKTRRREQRHLESARRREDMTPGVDPDLIDIVPGPQPVGT